MLALNAVGQAGFGFTLFFTLTMAQAGCPQQCSCPSIPPSCPPGVSWATDACGCCKVCARQFNQDCGPDQPCDHIKGLQCQMGAGGNPERGLCRAEALGRPCEFDGRMYQHSEAFQPSCQHRCICMDGVVGCMPMCPRRVPLPSPDWHCSRPRLARLPGQCCEEWLCDDDNRIAEGPGEDTPVLWAHPNAISKELLLLPAGRLSNSGGTFQEWISHPESHLLVTPKCFPQTTDWSECSASCGMGMSSRVTNKNAECRLVRETRLCQIRLCGSELLPSLKRGKKCKRTVRPREPVSITFTGCSTEQRYRPRSCGSCTDGRCCSPLVTQTVRLRFHCPDGGAFTRRVMWIQRCRCRRTCPAQTTHTAPSLSLHNDIHTFTD